MADLIVVSVIVAFFALCVLYLRWCDRIIGADDFTTGREDATASSGHALVAVPADSTEVPA